MCLIAIIPGWEGSNLGTLAGRQKVVRNHWWLFLFSARSIPTPFAGKLITIVLADERMSK
jgi:hypothetical protein